MNARFTSFLESTFHSTVLITTLGLFANHTLAQGYPKTVTDDLGTTITLQQKPLKISSKMLFTDEVLLELVDEEQISSLTNLATNPTFSNVADKVPTELVLLDMNVERIIANQPDLVFAANWTDQGKVKQLRDAGIQVFLVQTPFTLDGIQRKIRQVGEIVGESSNADAIIAQMNRKLDQQIVTPQAPMSAIDYNSWGASSTKNSTWHTILSQANIVNAVADFEADQFGQAPMSKELVVQLNPQVMFVPGWIYGDDNAAASFRQQVLSDPALRSVSALRNNRVIAMPERLRGTYSQYIVDAIIFANHAVYK